MKKTIVTLALAVLAVFGANAQKLTPVEANMLNYWKQEVQENKGYVWTINIRSGSLVHCEDLMTAAYNLNVSVSHVGPTMYGFYNGDFELKSIEEHSGLNELLEMLGGKFDYNNEELKARSGNFLFKITDARKEQDQIDAFESSFGEGAIYEGMNSYTRTIVKDVLDGFYEGYVAREKSFEKAQKPVGWTYGLEVTGGRTDIATGNLKINNGYFSTYMGASYDGNNGRSETSAEAAWGHVRTFLGDTKSANYRDRVDMPFPHTIKIYPNNQVVFELYAATGGPVTVKFYGTIDRVPVGSTTVVTGETIQKSKKTSSTDDSLNSQLTYAKDEIARRQAAKEALAAQEKMKEEESRLQEVSAEDAEALNLWKTKLSMFPMWTGGHDYWLEDNSEYNNGELSYSFTVKSDTNLMPAYFQKLRQAGFKWQTLKTDVHDSFYKVIDGKYYGLLMDQDCAEWEDGTSHFFLYVLDKNQVSRVKENGEK